ncbi:hypothetical protein FRC08_001861 [Ceratobasidium sp. 394]|nr:hypothetical protein FRC08_001861 [Ceratobasidium sp. 394]KAG9090259.1 hypothetical protein FS749_000696 [Ceratobasidium sp. UAMH 11750]
MGTGWGEVASVVEFCCAILNKHIYDKDAGGESAGGKPEAWSIIKSLIDIFDLQIAELGRL